jgi:S1-C subfamily serine protease
MRSIAADRPTIAATGNLPSISDLEHLQFVPTDHPSVPDGSYSELSTIRSLFAAYNAGSEAVAKYRDPVLTRGSSGITVFRTVSPAVVVVIVGSVKQDKFDPEGIGTGAIVDAHGYVLTNWHVINGYREAVIFLKPSHASELTDAQAHIATVVYQNPTIDLALLKIIDPPSNLPHITVGSIDQAQVAEDIHIIGHPHGNLWSYSTGVISQIRDDFTWKYEDGSQHMTKVLQLQTAINPGNSGGPVVDDSGRMLGLVAMIEEGQNLDYAIAADVIKNFLRTGLGMTTRGSAHPTANVDPPGKISTATLSDGSVVSKVVYSDVVVYSVVGKPAEGMEAKFSDGTEISARGYDSTGHFESWHAKLPEGRELTATASAGSVTRISHKE